MRTRPGQLEISVLLTSLSASTRIGLLKDIQQQCPGTAQALEGMKIRASRVFMEVSPEVSVSAIAQNVPVPYCSGLARANYRILLRPRLLKRDCGPQSIAGDLVVTTPGGDEVVIPLTVCQYLCVYTMVKKSLSAAEHETTEPGHHSTRCYLDDLESTFDEFGSWCGDIDRYLKTPLQVREYIYRVRELFKESGFFPFLISGDMRQGFFLTVSPNHIELVGSHPWEADHI
jgi:hypothetical protein